MFGLMASPTTSRRIYFYRVDAGTDADGTPHKFQATTTVKTVARLNGKKDLYLAEGENVVFALVDDEASPCHLRFVRSRRVDLPQMEDNGAIKELSIPAHAGVADCTHLVLFPDGIVGADWNYHAPRATAFAHYVNVKTSPSPLSIRPLLRQDVANALERWESVRVVDLKIRASFIPTVREVSNTLAESFESARRVGGAEEVGLLLRPRGRARRASLADGIMPIIRGLLGREYRDQVTKFQITGRNQDNGRLEAIDLLKEQLVFSEDVIKIAPSTRALDPTSAYNAIERAYREHEAEVKHAPTIY